MNIKTLITLIMGFALFCSFSAQQIRADYSAYCTDIKSQCAAQSSNGSCSATCDTTTGTWWCQPTCADGFESGSCSADAKDHCVEQTPSCALCGNTTSTACHCTLATDHAYCDKASSTGCTMKYKSGCGKGETFVAVPMSTCDAESNVAYHCPTNTPTPTNKPAPTNTPLPVPSATKVPTPTAGQCALKSWSCTAPCWVCDSNGMKVHSYSNNCSPDDWNKCNCYDNPTAPGCVTAIPTPTNMPTSTPAPTDTPMPTNTPTPTPTPTPAQPTAVIQQPKASDVSKVAANAVKNTQRWICLDALPCSRTACSSNVTPDHSVRLQAKSDIAPIALQKTYIFECLQTNSGPKCTSGDAAIDAQYLGMDNLSFLKSNYKYHFGKYIFPNGSSAPNPTDAGVNGTVGPYEWESYTDDNIGRIFMAMNIVDPNAIVGKEGGQQQALLAFSSSGKTCVMIKWDPYGQVFDSYTLEPIKDATVTLLEKSKSGIFAQVDPNNILGGLTNPVKTTENGAYSFVVPDGTYRLRVSHPDYEFPGSTLNNGEYKSLYSDIYTGQEFVQKGSIKHFDIPLNPKDRSKSLQTFNKVQPKIVTKYETYNKVANTYDIEGTVSHPYTEIKQYSKKLSQTTGEFVQTRLLDAVYADKYGNFTLHINAFKLQPGESLGNMELTKNLSKLGPTSESFWDYVESLFRSVFNAKVNAEQTKVINVTGDTVLPYINGFTYDERGRIQKNVHVNINLSFSRKSFASTVSDDTGHLTIYTPYLPNMPYYLEYQIGDTVREVSLTQFMKENAAFLTSHNINLNIPALGK